MDSRVDSYQSFIPTLKPKSLVSKSSKKLVIQDKKHQIQVKKVPLKEQKSSSVINSVKSMHSQGNSSILPISTSASVRCLIPSETKKIILSKLSKIKTSASRLIHLKSLRKHSRNLTTLEPVTSSQINFKRLDLGHEEKSRKLPLTERIIRKRKNIKKTLKIVEKKVNYFEKIRNFDEILQPVGNVGNVVLECSGNLGLRKVIMLDKLVECNESPGSSLSSTVLEIIPRYK
jgi:hypothetical protein